jgi:hypothetical protein
MPKQGGRAGLVRKSSYLDMDDCQIEALNKDRGMLYLVGGCSRSGKSLLAERIRVRHGIPWFALDALKMSLFDGAPGLGIDPEADDLLTADQMWPVVKGLLENILIDGRDYLVEGVNLRPAAVAELIGARPSGIRACFLGYPGMAVETKRDLVRRFAGGPNDWLEGADEAYIESHLRRCIEISAEFQDECARVNLPFVDTGQDFDAALDKAERVITSG